MSAAKSRKDQHRKANTEKHRKMKATPLCSTISLHPCSGRYYLWSHWELSITDMAPADAASSPGFPFHSPKPRQITKLAVAGPSGSRSAPQSPHTPTNLAQSALTTNFNPDGSLSVVRNDDDANNSGLLDLSPALTRVIKSRPNFAASRPDGTPLSKRARANPSASQSQSQLAEEDISGLGTHHILPKQRRSTTAKSRLSNRANFGEIVPSSQPAEDYLHSDPLFANGLAASSDVEESQKERAASSPQPANVRAAFGAESADEADDISLDGEEEEAASTLTRLRRWRQDAMQQHLYDTAIFWGSKVLALETSAAAFNDAYHLAQCFFYTHQYARAEQLLTSPLRTGASRSNRTLGPMTSNAEGGGSSAMKHTGAEGFLASDNVQEDDDALHEVLQRTRSSSILPASIMARSTTKDSMYSATSSTTGKRKKRDFNVTATGTGSSDDSGSFGGAPGASDDEEFLKDASSFNADADAERDGSVVFRPSNNASHRTTNSKRRIKEDIDLQSDLEKVKSTSLAPATGPILVNHSLACRYLAAQCQVRLAKYHEALDLLGETSHWGASSSTANNKRPSADGGIKLGSSVAYLRGQIHLRLEDLPRAKESFMAALALDVKNYEAFSALIEGQMLGTEEQWTFVQSLEYVAQAGDEPGAREDYELVRLLYTTQLSKQGKKMAESTARARHRLEAEYGLEDDVDVLHGLASELFARERFADAFIVTSRILSISADHPRRSPSTSHAPITSNIFVQRSSCSLTGSPNSHRNHRSLGTPSVLGTPPPNDGPKRDGTSLKPRYSTHVLHRDGSPLATHLLWRVKAIKPSSRTLPLHDSSPKAISPNFSWGWSTCIKTISLSRGYRSKVQLRFSPTIRCWRMNAVSSLFQLAILIPPLRSFPMRLVWRRRRSMLRRLLKRPTLT